MCGFMSEGNLGRKLGGLTDQNPESAFSIHEKRVPQNVADCVPSSGETAILLIVCCPACTVSVAFLWGGASTLLSLLLTTMSGILWSK